MNHFLRASSREMESIVVKWFCTPLHINLRNGIQTILKAMGFLEVGGAEALSPSFAFIVTGLKLKADVQLYCNGAAPDGFKNF